MVPVQPEVTPAKPGPSIGGAIIVGGFVSLVFDNFALGLIAGIFAAAAIANRQREAAGSAQKPSQTEGAE
jgi:hypothetical protein